MDNIDFVNEKMSKVEKVNEEMKKIRDLSRDLIEQMAEEKINKVSINGCLHLLDQDQVERITEVCHKELALKLRELNNERSKLIQSVNKKLTKTL